MKRATAARRFQAVAPHLAPGRLLDVGCSDGRFLEEARRRGIDAEGIDISATAVESARERGLPASRARIDDHAPGYRYACITAFDVLEHVRDPRGFLRSIDRLLAPAGMFALATPDTSSVFRRLMGRRWYFYIPEEHLHLFSPRSVRVLLSSENFEIVQRQRTTKPLTFAYSLTQLAEYNPGIYRVLRSASPLIPRNLQELSIPLYIGEMMVIGRRRSEAAPASGGAPWQS